MRSPALIVSLLLLALVRPALAAVEIVNGPMIGHVSDSSAHIWMQLNTSAKVAIHVFDRRNNEIAAVSSDVEGPAPFVYDTPIGSLEPNTLYHLELSIDDKKVNLPQNLEITTAPVPGDAATFSVAFGSGLDPKSDATALFKSVRLARPREFLFLGNCGLLPATEADFPAKHRDAFRTITDFHKQVRATPELQPLFRTIPTCAVWDDRDFGPALAGKDFVHAQESLIAFTRFWSNPDFGTPDVPGVFCNFTLADADFFMLDDRLYRTTLLSPAAAATQPAGSMLGEGQLAWLKEKLKASSARFKIIACGNPMLRDQSRAQSWADYPAEREAFLKWIFDSKITGVLFISGGGVTGGLTVRKPDAKVASAYPLFDLTSASLSTDTPPPAPAATLPATPDQSLSLGVVGDHHFGELEFGGPRTKRFVTLRLHDAAGKTKIEKVIFADDLKPAP